MPAVAVGAPERESYRTPDFEKVPEPDWLVMRAELLLLMGRNEAAERIYLDVAKKFPNSPAAWTGLAILALRDRHYETARDLFRKAIELGSRDADTYFEYAMLLDQTGAEPAEVDRTLFESIGYQPEPCRGAANTRPSHRRSEIPEARDRAPAAAIDAVAGAGERVSQTGPASGCPGSRAQSAPTRCDAPGRGYGPERYGIDTLTIT